MSTVTGLDMLFYIVIVSNLALLLFDILGVEKPATDSKPWSPSNLNIVSGMVVLAFVIAAFTNVGPVVEALERVTGDLDLWKWLGVAFVAFLAGGFVKIVAKSLQA